MFSLLPWAQREQSLQSRAEQEAAGHRTGAATRARPSAVTPGTKDQTGD